MKIVDSGFAPLSLTALLAAAAWPLPSLAAPSGGFDFALERLAFQWLEVSLDRDSSKFQEYRELEEGFRLEDLRLSAASGDRRRLVVLGVANAGRDDARYTLGYADDGRFRLAIDHNLIPHRFGNGAKFLWSENRPGVFEIADATQETLQRLLTARRAAGGAINFAFLNGLVTPLVDAAATIDVGLRRDRTAVRAELGGLGELRWGLDYRHEKRSGHRAYGASFGFGNVTEMPEPIRYESSDLELRADWRGENYGFVAGARRSVFKNDLLAMYWDNPFRLTDGTDPNAYQAPTTSTVNGAARGFAALAPDNHAGTLFASGQGQAGGWWMNGHFSLTRMRQDEELLPYTLNSSIVGRAEDGRAFDPTAAAALPVATADRQVDLTVLGAAAGRRLGRDFSLALRYSFYDYENNGPRVSFPGYVRYHGVWEEIGRITVPAAYSKEDLSAELAWDLGRAHRLALRYQLRRWEREYRETAGTDEDVLKLSFDSKPGRRISWRAGWEQGERTIDGEYRTEAQEYSFVHPEGINNLPGLRQPSQAARKYSEANALVQLSPLDTLQLSLGYSRRDEDYEQSEFGLASDEIEQYSVDLDFSPGDRLTFFAFGHRGERQSFQHARQSAATPSTNPRDDWDLLLDEATDTYGFGLEAKPAARLKLGLSGNWSKSDGEADFRTPASSSLPVPLDIGNYEDIELLSVKATLEWQLKEHLSLALGYLYEDFTLDRFILQGLKPYLPAALLLAAREGDYRADVYFAQVGYKF
jgi:MtrB/PioB family decaheme-associated outer membrane protein